jgi:hypothetical protein
VSGGELHRALARRDARRTASSSAASARPSRSWRRARRRHLCVQRRERRRAAHAVGLAVTMNTRAGRAARESGRRDADAASLHCDGSQADEVRHTVRGGRAALSPGGELPGITCAASTFTSAARSWMSSRIVLAVRRVLELVDRLRRQASTSSSSTSVAASGSATTASRDRSGRLRARPRAAAARQSGSARRVRAGPLHCRAGRRAADTRAVHEGDGRQDVRHHGRRDERPAAAEPLLQLSTVSSRSSGTRPRATVPVDVVGPICESGDFLALDRPIPRWSRASCSSSARPARTASRWRPRTTRGHARPRCSCRGSHAPTDPSSRNL